MRGLIMVWLAVALVIGGCASAGSPQTTTQTTPPSARQLSPTSPAGDEVCGELRPASGATTIEHASGTTTVPDDPQRIVVLDSDKLDTVCVLGLQSRLVGAVVLDGGPPRYLGPTIAAVEGVGSTTEPDLEKIASLQPDLILGSKFRTPDLYDRLSQIAPTVFTALVGSTWRENLLLDAAALRRADQARALLTDVTEEAAETGRQLSGSPGLAGTGPATGASIVRFIPGAIRVYGPTSFAGTVLELAAIPRPEFQQLNGAKDRRFTEISVEELTKADGTTIYVTAYGTDATSDQQRLLQDPLWQTLAGVRAGRVFIVSDELWMTGIGVIAARGILADLKESLG